MRLTPREENRILIFAAAELARRSRASGLRLSHPEAVALITDEVLHAAREGKSYPEVEAVGYSALGTGDVVDGVADLVTDLQIEATFSDGTKLVVLHRPIA